MFDLTPHVQILLSTVHVVCGRVSTACCPWRGLGVLAKHRCRIDYNPLRCQYHLGNPDKHFAA